ncbi:MAG TPA: type II toxin-antitoxin system prevent-host-death family antitoxin [Pseudonocardiaceae bacterium]
MTVNVNIHEAKTHLSRLLEHVANGERVIISKAGQPVADLVPHQRTPVVFGGLHGELSYHPSDGPDDPGAAVVFGGLHGELSYSDDSFADPDPDIQRLFYGDDVAAP